MKLQYVDNAAHALAEAGSALQAQAANPDAIQANAKAAGEALVKASTALKNVLTEVEDSLPARNDRATDARITLIVHEVLRDLLLHLAQGESFDQAMQRVQTSEDMVRAEIDRLSS